MAGVNWNVKLMACKFLSAAGNGTTSDAIDCLTYVAMMKDRGVNIVATNNSWGGGAYSQALYDAIDAQRQRGILFIAAAGNDNSDNDSTPSYPASIDLPNVVPVAATTRTDARASFSNYGRRTVLIGAPGAEILSTIRGNSYGQLSGTSMATPHVTGVAALLKAQDASRDWRAIKNLILAGGNPVSSMATTTVSGRRLNAFGSLTCSSVAVESRLKPTTDTVWATAGQAITLSVLNINCASPNGEATVTVSGGNPAVTLKDNGVSPDQVAGDGIYSGSFTPISGSYTLTFPGGDNVSVQFSNATYDSAFRAPRCPSRSVNCNTGPLLVGRDTMSGGGAEPHQPNTINTSCADGTSGFHNADESIEGLQLTMVGDGTVFAPGRTLKVDVTVYAFSSSDHLDVYWSGSATSPTWAWLGTFTPARGGLQTFSVTFPAGSSGAHALRANFRYLGTETACSTGVFDDHDDLVYNATVPFTDDVLSAGTPVKAAHITELRTRINAVRAARGLAPFSFTDATLAPGVTTINGVHITQLRNALSEVYAAAGRPSPAYTDPGLVAGYSIKAVHINELRDAVVVLE